MNFVAGGGFAVSLNGRFYLRGIVSAGVVKHGMCDNDNYVVFTDVAQFTKWIDEIMKNNS